MKIFFFFSILHDLYCEVAKELVRLEPGTEFSGILYGLGQLRDLERRGFPSRQLCVFSQELCCRLAQAQAPPDFLVRWEQLQGVSLSTILSTDRRYSKFGREEGLRIAAIAIQCCEAWLDRIRPDVIVAEGIDDLLSHVLYYSARDRGIPYLITYASPAPNRVAIYSNPQNHWERVEEIFFSLKKGSLTAEQRARAQAVVWEYREKHLLPSYLNAGYNRLFTGIELHSLWKVARGNWLDPARRLDPSYAGSVYEIIARKFERIFRAAVADRRYFQQPCAGEKYVFFPLQMEPECTTLVFAPFYANQLYVIECLSKSLPIDHVLYVKEHPVMLGRRPLSDYRAICSLPNVRLISPRVISHALIREASAVVTVTSSVGWEALIHAKPVIVLGNVWFAACDLVRKVRTSEDLPAALASAIANHRPDEELLLKFVTASLEGTYPGQIEHPDYSPGVLSHENAAALANAIREHLAWVGLAGDRGWSRAPQAGITASELPELREAARSGSANRL